MTRTRWIVAACLAVLVAGLAEAAARRPARAAASIGMSYREERNIRDQDIAFYEARIARDPTGALDLVRVGSLYLNRARATGEEADLMHAEEAARRSLSNRSERNEGAWQLLVAAFLGQHRFLEAKEAADRLVALDPESAAGQAIRGEVLLELGAYPEADRIFHRLAPRRYQLAIAPRFARWQELRGHSGSARRLLEWARDVTARRAEVSPSAVAWYELRLGEMALRFGATGEAARRLDAGLALVPDDWRLLAARARLANRLSKWDTAILLGDSSLARHLDPATLATVGDAWRSRSDSAQAAQYYRAMEAATQAPRGGFHRAWYLALLDHDLRIPQVLAAVTADLRTRRDVYGYDLLAWVLYKSGRFGAARTAMGRALEWATEDPLLTAHRKAIEAAR